MNSIPTDIDTEIKQILASIERDHNVRILYACESGSRAWGFESHDSDYDVRFIYARPLDWYLSINVEKRRDVIELPIDNLLDVNGWDIRKALQLFHKCNPPLNEWLVSPIVYHQYGPFADRLRELAPLVYNPVAAHYHYLQMAKRNYREELTAQSVRRKKYLYVLRPLLAVKWIEQGRGVVPTEFEKLVSGVVTDATLRAAIDELLQIKRSGSESDKGPRLPAIHAFIESAISRHGKSTSVDSIPASDINVLNELFRTTLEEDAPEVGK